MSIIIFIAVLALIVFSHELGHFWAAKRSGIKVEEFGLGFPPRLFSIVKNETKYSLNLLPLGGFVKILGEDGGGAQDPESFSAKPVGTRVKVIAAGVVFNVLFAWIIITLGYVVGLPMSKDSFPRGAIVGDQKVFILQVQTDTPAERAGIKPGDKIVGLNSAEEVGNFTSANRGKEVEFRYERNGETFITFIKLDSNPAPGKGALGIVMSEGGIVKLPVHLAVWEGVKTTISLVEQTFVAIVYFFTDLFRGEAGLDQVSGPVGIVSITGTAARLGFSYILFLVASLSINLAVMNILPFPALDGGRILFLLVEKIKGSPVNPKISSAVHGAGLVFLLILMIMVTYHDILKII